MVHRININIVLLTFLLSGCANVTTLKRHTTLPFSKDAEGIAIHLDAKQRLVYAKQFGAICAEPNPDALSSVASALSAGVKAMEKGSGEVSSSLVETASNIGLRTQSIQLMRDALYRVCEAYYGKALNSVQLAELHKRYQDVMIGVLAIEQLTGAVTAKQVVHSGSAHADISGQLNNVATLLDQAIKNEAEAKAELVLVEKEKQALETEIATAKESVANAEAGSQEQAALQENLVDLQDKLELVNIRKEAAEKSKEQAEKTRAETEKNHGALVQRASATAAGKGVFSEVKQAKTLDAASTAKVAQAVENIVREIVKKERLSDKCLEYLMNVEEISDKNREIVDTCISAVRGRTSTGKRYFGDEVTIRVVKKDVEVTQKEILDVGETVSVSRNYPEMKEDKNYPAEEEDK